MKKILPALFAAALAVYGADVTGKYTGTAEFQNPNGESRKGEVYMDLKQDAGKLTGAAGPNESETFPISNGKVDGDNVTFDVSPHDGPVMKVVLKHDNGKLKGEAMGEREGAKMKVVFELTRK